MLCFVYVCMYVYMSPSKNDKFHSAGHTQDTVGHTEHTVDSQEIKGSTTHKNPTRKYNPSCQDLKQTFSYRGRQPNLSGSVHMYIYIFIYKYWASQPYLAAIKRSESIYKSRVHPTNLLFAVVFDTRLNTKMMFNRLSPYKTCKWYGKQYR